MTHTRTAYPNRIALHAGKKGACLAEVGGLASVFEKSATELQLKQKLQKCKCTIKIETFNTGTLNRTGQLPELTASMIDDKIDIIYMYKNTDAFIAKIQNAMNTGNRGTFVSASA